MFTNSTDSVGVNVISITGEELLGEDRNIDFTGTTVSGTRSVLDIVYTKDDFSNSGQLGVLLAGFASGDLSVDTLITSIRIQNDGTDGFFPPSADQMNLFPGARGTVTTAELFVNGMVTLINNPAGATFRPRTADFLNFTAEAVDNTATNITLRLTSKTNGLWKDVTLVATSDQPAVPTTAVSITVPGTLDVFTPRVGVTYETIGGRHFYTLDSDTRLQIGNAIANSTGTASTIAARGTLNHDTFFSQIICERELSPSNAIVDNYAVVTAHAGNTANTIEPSVYNYGIQTSSISGPRVVTNISQSISVGTIVLVPQNDGANDNKRFRNLVEDTSVTLTTTFTNTTNWQELADSPVVFSDGIGLVFTNSKTGGDASPSFNLWFGRGQNGVYGGTSGAFLGATAHGTANKGGIININGGRVAGKFNLGIGSNATLRNFVNAKFLVDDKGQPGGNEWLMRVTGLANIDTRDFTMVGGSISFVVAFGNYNDAGGSRLVGTTTASLQRQNGGVALWNQALLGMPNTVLAKSYITFRNPDFINNVVDIAPYETSATRFSGTRVQNCVQGSTLNVNGGETSSAGVRTANSNHYVIGTRQIETNVRATADDSLQIGSIYMIDTNRNSNLSSPVSTIDGVDYSDSDGYTYFGKFNSSSNITAWDAIGSAGNNDNALGAKLLNNSGENEVALFTYSLTRAERVRAAQDQGIWRKNIRGLGDAGASNQDDFDLEFWMYENLHQRLTTNFAGRDIKSLEFKTVADTHVSDLRAAITMKNAGAQGTGMTLGNTSITTTTSAYTLDEIYDLVKIKKEQTLAAIQIPNVTSLLLGPVGVTIPFEDLILTIGTGLWSVGANHTTATHNTILNAGKFNLSGGIILTAPTLSDLPATVGTSTLNPTNTIFSTGGHTIGSGSVINGNMSISGNANSFSGIVNGDVAITDTDSDDNTFGGIIAGKVDTAGSGTDSFNGQVQGDITLDKSTLESTSDFEQTIGNIVAQGTGKKHILNGKAFSNVTFGSGDTTVNAVVPGIFTATSGLHIFNTGTNITGTTTVGDGNLRLLGTYASKVKAGNATSFHTVDAIISAGGLEIGTSVSGINLIEGTIQGPVIIGNGATTLDAGINGNVSLGNGTIVFNSVVNGDVSHGTGLFRLGSSSKLTGKLTKNGSGNSNLLTVSPGADISDIDLVVPSGTLEVFGVTSGFKSVTGNVNFNVADTFTTFQVDSTLPTGRVIFKDRAAAAGTFLKDQVHTTGSTTLLGSITNNSTTPTNYDIYYKPDNTFGVNGIFFLTTFVKSDNNAGENRTIDVTRIEHPNVLTQEGEQADLTGLTAGMNTITTGLVGTIAITGATSVISGPLTQGLLMRVTNDGDYLRLLANNNLSVDLIAPTQNSGTSIDRSDITLSAASQQSITAVVGIGTGTLVTSLTVTLPDMTTTTIPSVFIFPNPAGVTVDQVEQGVGRSLDSRDLTKVNVDDIIDQKNTIPAEISTELDDRDLTKANVDEIIDQKNTIPVEIKALLDAIRLTRENMIRLGRLIPIDDKDPTP